jgi:endogenous inhibitor of DNA gyrase (YacG/DUF329 family)
MALTAPEPPPPRRPVEVICPSCGDKTVFAPSNPYRPFCSARCKNVDLGAWASESYRVAAPPAPEDDPNGSD